MNISKFLKFFKKQEVKPDILDFYLVKYVRKNCRSLLENCGEVLGSDSALEGFAEFWTKYKPEMMIMLTGLEYEFLHNETFTESELAAVRHVIGNVALFFENSKNENAIRKLSE